MKRLMILLLVFWGCTVSSVSASNITTQSASWGYQPLHSTRAERPTFQFRSTSTCVSTIGNSVYTPTTDNTTTGVLEKKMRRDGWDEEEPTGPGVGNVDTPVGSPWILLAFALLYFIYKRRIARA